MCGSSGVVGAGEVRAEPGEPQRGRESILCSRSSKSCDEDAGARHAGVDHHLYTAPAPAGEGDAGKIIGGGGAAEREHPARRESPLRASAAGGR